VSYLAKNFAYSTLASPITDVATSLTVGAGHGDRFPAITAPDYTKVVIEDGSGNREVIHVTARTLGSDVFTTIVRAQEGTTARNWAAGVSVELRQTADLVQTAMGHPAATSAAHAATAISNTPAGGIAATTVQAAINELDSEKLGAGAAQVQSQIRFTAGGTADAITGTLSPVIASYVAGLRVTTTTAGANTLTAPTINLHTLGNKTIKKRDSSGSKVALVAGDYNASGPFDFEYDGTDFILLNPVVSVASAAEVVSASDVTKAVPPGRVKDSPYAAKVVCRCTQSAGSYTLRYGQNVASVNKLGTGQLRIDFTTAFANAFFACVATVGTAAGTVASYSHATGSVTIEIRNSAGVQADMDFSIVCFGAQ
jgi:hypothetical protein